MIGRKRRKTTLNHPGMNLVLEGNHGVERSAPPSPPGGGEKPLICLWDGESASLKEERS